MRHAQHVPAALRAARGHGSRGYNLANSPNASAPAANAPSSDIHGNFSLAVSYWRSLEAIHAGRRHAQHRVAKENGQRRWFVAYFTRIGRVERDY